jgi:hypothetical protein
MSFVNENGSESPLSNGSNLFTYSGSSITRNGNSGVPTVCAVVDIPTGPVGTVARRIYRTQSDGNLSNFYFVEEIKNNLDEVYVDYRDDTKLGAQAPALTDSVRFPAPSARFACAFKNCVFVDGGEMEPTRLYFSAPLEPDRFRAFDFFEVGTREGGDIVGLEAYYNSLLVFRENAIDLIRGDAVNGFEIVPFIEGVGAFSHNAIVAIPSFGVSFLSRDGVYLIGGGLDGGSDLSLKKISKGIDEIFERVSIDAMPAAVGAYSAKEQELHFYLPTTGRPRLNFGIVFHTNLGVWSQRENFPIRCISVDRDGNLLFGADDYTTNTRNQRLTRGIYVISAIRQEGLSGGGGDLVLDGAPTSHTFRSQWIDMGLPYIKKYPKYLYLYAITTGDHDVQVSYYANRNWNNAYEGGDRKMQVADEADQPVYDLAKWNEVEWQDKRLAQIRYPISMGAVSEFAFEFTTTDPIIFIGYSIEYQADGATTIKGKFTQ